MPRITAWEVTALAVSRVVDTMIDEAAERGLPGDQAEAMYALITPLREAAEELVGLGTFAMDVNEAQRLISAELLRRMVNGMPGLAAFR